MGKNRPSLNAPVTLALAKSTVTDGVIRNSFFEFFARLDRVLTSLGDQSSGLRARYGVGLFWLAKHPQKQPRRA